MKICLKALLLLLVTNVTLFAQGDPGYGKSSLGVLGEVSLPVGDFDIVAGTGYGGMLKYQWGVDSRTVATASAGYIVWSEQELLAGASVQPKAIEAMLGGKYYFVPGFYGSLEGGFYILSYARTGNVTGYEGTTWRFILPMGIGYQNSGFDVGARYIFGVDVTNFSFTLGYHWAL